MKPEQLSLFKDMTFYCEHCKGRRVWRFQLHQFKKRKTVRVVTHTCQSCHKTTQSEYSRGKTK